jgi:hypothetical protein
MVDFLRIFKNFALKLVNYIFTNNINYGLDEESQLQSQFDQDNQPYITYQPKKRNYNL